MRHYAAQFFQGVFSLLPLLRLFFLVVGMLDGQTPDVEIVTYRRDNVMLVENQH